jgi:hypothetical protein
MDRSFTLDKNRQILLYQFCVIKVSDLIRRVVIVGWLHQKVMRRGAWLVEAAL